MAIKTLTKPAATPRDLNEAVLLMTTSMAEMSQRIAEANDRTDLRMVEMSQRIAEANARTDQLIAESNNRTDRLIAESNDRTDRRIAESNALTDQRMAEMSQRIAESNDRTDQRIDKFIAEARALIKGLSLNLGNVGNELGEITEFITLPGIRHEMKAHNLNFTRSLANKKISGSVRGVKQRVAEVDLLLFNNKEAMAIEAKTNLSAEDVNRHLDRLKILRKYEQEADVAGKTLYGAMIGIFIENHARKFALKNGLYILEVLEEEKKIKTEAPSHIHVW